MNDKLDGCDICGGAHTNDEHLAADDTPLDPEVLAAAERIADRYASREEHGE